MEKRCLLCQGCGNPQTDPETIAAYVRDYPYEQLWDIPYICNDCRNKKEQLVKERILCLFQPN